VAVDEGSGAKEIEHSGRMLPGHRQATRLEEPDAIGRILARAHEGSIRVHRAVTRKGF
jgi:hypothetical protein